MKGIPTRIAIGTQKAASTYLYNLLASHPDVSLSERTEVNFYHSFYEQGVDWYLSTFKKDGVRIDISPKYFMTGSIVAPRIKETLGDTPPKLLLILRNPIDYLNSHFSMQCQQGFFKKSAHYKHAPTHLIDFIEQYPAYAERGKYMHTLEDHWLTVFSKDQIKIVFFEELVQKDTKEQVLTEIQTFWDLTPHILTASSTSKNRALRSPFLHKLKHSVVTRPRLKTFLKQSSLFQLIYQHILTSNSRKSISVLDRKKLAAMYRDDVKRLETLIGRKTPWEDFTQ